MAFNITKAWLKKELRSYKLMEQHAAQAPALRERLPPIDNHQPSIVNNQSISPINRDFHFAATSLSGL
jgi:hypothetical protein